MNSSGSKGTIRQKRVLALVFFIITMFVLSFPYPWNQGAGNPGAPAGQAPTEPGPEGGMIPEIWSGGTIPDENGYFGWAYIYYSTGKTYIPLEDVGPDKIQQVDFFIGDSPETCVFTRVEVSNNLNGPGWEQKTGNVSVVVYNGLNTGVKGIDVEIREEKTGIVWNGTTDENGGFTAEVPPGFYTATVYAGDLSLKMGFATNYMSLNYPIIVRAELEQMSGSSAEANIHVDHYINRNLQGVKIYSGVQGREGEPLGETDSEGNFSMKIPLKNKVYHVLAVKETNNIMPPVGSVVVKVNGEYALANRWPPGYSYLIIPFWVLGLKNFITIFSFLVGSLSVYFLSRRLYGENVAFFSTLLFMISGLGIMVLFSRGMADYASIAFSTAGIAFLIESLRKTGDRREQLLMVVFGLIGGLSLGFAVTMRYSTATVLLGPLVYFSIKFLRAFKEKSDRKSLMKKAVPLVAFAVGLSIVALLLISYNTALFGGPLNSGYQMDHRLELVDGNLTVKSPEKNMLEQYFHPSSEALGNAFNRIIPQLFLLLPVVFIFPLGLALDWRRSRAWLLFFWAFPTIFLYMQLKWVGQVPFEDMRYFLPVLPPAAILSAYAMEHIPMDKREKLTYILFALLTVIGFMAAYYGISWQIHRHEIGPMFRAPLPLFFVAMFAYFIIYAVFLWKMIKRKFHTEEGENV